MSHLSVHFQFYLGESGELVLEDTSNGKWPFYWSEEPDHYKENPKKWVFPLERSWETSFVSITGFMFEFSWAIKSDQEEKEWAKELLTLSSGAGAGSSGKNPSKKRNGQGGPRRDRSREPGQ